MSQATNTMGGAIEDCAPTAFAGKSKSIAPKPKKQGAGSKPAAKANKRKSGGAASKSKRGRRSGK